MKEIKITGSDAEPKAAHNRRPPTARYIDLFLDSLYET